VLAVSWLVGARPCPKTTPTAPQALADSPSAPRFPEPDSGPRSRALPASRSKSTATHYRETVHSPTHARRPCRTVRPDRRNARVLLEEPARSDIEETHCGRRTDGSASDTHVGQPVVSFVAMPRLGFETPPYNQSSDSGRRRPPFQRQGGRAGSLCRWSRPRAPGWRVLWSAGLGNWKRRRRGRLRPRRAPMAHNERRSTPLREGGIAVATGAVYGVVHTMVRLLIRFVISPLPSDSSAVCFICTAVWPPARQREGVDAAGQVDAR
jgi:hypothetical protein